MSKRRPVSDEDAALFRRETENVRPLDDERAPVYRRRPVPRPRTHPRDRQAEPPEPASPESIRHGERDGEQLFVRPGLQTKHVRNLRRGRIPVTAEADLHGMRIREARPLLARFLAECRRDGVRCARVIHGKGLGSRGGHAVLKWEVDRWLREHPGVMAFCTAQPRDGGTGAVYVLLKSETPETG